MFPIRLKAFYIARMATAVGCEVIACCYIFEGAFDADMFYWYDYVLAAVWLTICFVFCFRTELYWELGKKTRFAPTGQSAFGIGLRK